MEFTVGTEVRLLLGSPTMTIDKIIDTENIECKWFAKDSIHFKTLNIENLFYVKDMTCKDKLIGDEMLLVTDREFFETSIKNHFPNHTVSIEWIELLDYFERYYSLNNIYYPECDWRNYPKCLESIVAKKTISETECILFLSYDLGKFGYTASHFSGSYFNPKMDVLIETIFQFRAKFEVPKDFGLGSISLGYKEDENTSVYILYATKDNINEI